MNSLKWSFMLPLLVTSSAYAYDFGEPTVAEQVHLEAMNRARANPLAEAARVGLSSLFEGVAPGEISGDPLPPLTFNAQLLQAARAHNNEMLVNNYFEHNSFDGTPYNQRISNAGYRGSTTGENMAMRSHYSEPDLNQSSLDLHAQLFIDEGVTGRGHRTNILSADYKETGVSIVSGQQGDSLVSLATIDFGRDFSDSRSVLTGVAYDDANKNGVYDGGEGIAGIQLSVGDVTTTTVTTGGYGLPLAAGQYTVTIKHPSLGSMTRQITIAEQNVKLDILASEFSSSVSEPVVDPVSEPSTTSNNTLPDIVDPVSEPTTTDTIPDGVELVDTEKAQCVSKGKAYIQNFANITNGCYGLPNEPSEVIANVIYADTTRTAAPASFRGGVLAGNNFVKSTNMDMANLPNASVAFNYQPVVEHVGLTANLLIAVGIEKPVTLTEPQYDGSFDTNYFAFTENVGEIYPIDLYTDKNGWRNEVAKMQAQPYMTNVTLEAMQTVVLVPNDLTPFLQTLKAQAVSEAMLYFFIGYALSDGTIVFNNSPIIIHVACSTDLTQCYQ